MVIAPTHLPRSAQKPQQHLSCHAYRLESDGDFVVTELFLTTQICTSSSTELDPISLGE